MNKSCGLCVDNGACYTLEILTQHGTTGPVHVCWPCLQKRVGDLMYDFVPDRDPRVDGDRLGGEIGFTMKVTNPLPPTWEPMGFESLIEALKTQ